MPSSGYIFILIICSYNLIKRMWTIIAFRFNKNVTGYYFTNVCLWDFFVAVVPKRDNSFSSRAYSIIPISSDFSILFINLVFHN